MAPDLLQGPALENYLERLGSVRASVNFPGMALVLLRHGFRHGRAGLLLLEQEYLGLDVANLRRLPVLWDENHKSKQMVADRDPDKRMLPDVFRKD